MYDAVIVGAGPAGITAALYLARSGCSVLLFENLTPGGQVLLTEKLENYPGFPQGIKGYELADQFAAHLTDLNSIERPQGEVSSITGHAGDFTIKAEAGADEYHARVVLVCSGARHRTLGLEKEEALIGRGVSYCAICDGNFYRNQVVAVAGGGNSALEETLYLANIASKVHLIHRRNAFRGYQIYQDRIAANDKVEVHLSTVIEALEGEKELTGLALKNVATGAQEILPVHGLFIYVGFIPQTGFLPEAVERDHQGFIVTDTEMRTNVPGIFAAGDIRSKLCRQVITAAGDGATAAQAAFVFLEQLDG
ncbi:MAG: thioredoxin-disulfide reductase [Desulfovibrio sp.]|nr:thioredoxin-disulfide reductase [Desulfovibrio sp.]